MLEWLLRLCPEALQLVYRLLLLRALIRLMGLEEPLHLVLLVICLEVLSFDQGLIPLLQSQPLLLHPRLLSLLR